MILSILKKNIILISVIAIYFSLTFIINPLGEFTVGDDFYFKMQIDAFNKGLFTKNALIDPTFVGQGFLAYGWSQLFGSSFSSLKILSIIITVLFIIEISKLFDVLEFSYLKKILGLVIIVFNPYTLFYSYSFNTEIYYLFFTFAGIRFIFQLNEEYSNQNLFFSLLLTILSFSVRQYGIILFAPILYILHLNKKINKLNIFYITLALVSCILILLYPKYQNLEHLESISPISILKFDTLVDRVLRSYKFIPYLGVFILIPSLYLYKSLNRKFKFMVIILTVVAGSYFFSINVYSLESILYIEGIGAKYFTELKFTLVNNQIAKYIISILVTFPFIALIFNLIQNFKNYSKDKNIKLLLIFIVLSFFISSVSSKIFDRYFITFFLITSITSLFIAKVEKINFSIYGVCVSYIIISFLYNYENINNLKIKWDLAHEMTSQNITDESNLFVSINYTRYTTYTRRNDYEGLAKTADLDNFNCFVQNYTKGEENLLGKFLRKANDLVDTQLGIKNPIMKEFGFQQELKGDFSKKSKLYKEIEYPNPFYNIIGKSIGVRGFCN